MPAATAPDTTAQPPPEDLTAQLLKVAQLLQGPQQSYAPPAPVDRSIVSLLGEAVGGGTTGLSPADREAAGTRALLNFGANLSAASGPSVMPRSFGQIFAQGVSGAEQSLGGSEAVSASRLAAQQAYEEKQQELRLNAIREAIPLLTLQTQMQQAAAARGLAGGGGGAPAPGTSIGAVGSPDEFAQKFTPIAQTISDQTGLPVDYVLAQAAHETGFGKSPAAANNNFFGIMDPKTGKLAAYATPQEGAAAYVQLQMQSDRYANVPRTGTPAQIGDQMALAGYNPNVPAKDKTDSYGTRIGGVASMLARPKPGAPGAPPVASGGPAAPTATPTATAPAAAPGAPATTAPAAPVVATGGEAAGPGGLPTRSARMTTVSPAAQTDADIIAKGMVGAGADAATLQPPGPAAPPPVRVAGPGAPPAASPAPEAPPPPAPQYPDIDYGGATVRHPGPFADFSVRERLPTPTTEDFNPNLTPEQQAAFAVKAQQLALKRAQIDTLPFQDQPKARIEQKAEEAALAADQKNAVQAKAQAAGAAKTKFDETQNAAVQTRYDAALTDYRSAVTETAKQKAAINLANIQAGQTLRQKMAESDATEGNAQLGKLDDAAAGASNMQSLLTLIGPQLKNLPTGMVAQVLASHPDIVNYLKAAHFITGDQADATQLLQGLTAFMATEMKPKGLGPLRIQEMNAFQGALPQLLESDVGRQKAFAFMNAYTQRIQEEAEFAHDHFKRDVPNAAPDAAPGSTMPAHNLDKLWSTMGKSPDQGGLGSVLPMWTGGAASTEDLAKYTDWEQRQQSKPGNAYWALRRDPKTGRRGMELMITPPPGG